MRIIFQVSADLQFCQLFAAEAHQVECGLEQSRIYRQRPTWDNTDRGMVNTIGLVTRVSV
jgi:hypothetical protein